jgi:hypothetical protein
MEYNAKIGIARKMEEANFARIQGQVVRQQARLAQIQTIAQTGTSLLSMSSGTTASSPYGVAQSGRFQTSQGRIVGGA